MFVFDLIALIAPWALKQKDTREVLLVAVVVLASLLTLQAAWCGPRQSPPSDSGNVTLAP